MLDPPAPSMAPRAAPRLQFSPEDHRNNDAPQTFRSDEAPGQTSTVGVGQDRRETREPGRTGWTELLWVRQVGPG